MSFSDNLTIREEADRLAEYNIDFARVDFEIKKDHKHDKKGEIMYEWPTSITY